MLATYLRSIPQPPPVGRFDRIGVHVREQRLENERGGGERRRRRKAAVSSDKLKEAT